MSTTEKEADGRPLSTLFVMIAELAMAMGEAPMSKYSHCWEIELSGPPALRIAVNGNKEARRVSFAALDLPPFNAYVEYDGWPWAQLDPFGGMVLGHDYNEDAAIAVIRAAIQAASEATP